IAPARGAARSHGGDVGAASRAEGDGSWTCPPLYTSLNILIALKPCNPQHPRIVQPAPVPNSPGPTESPHRNRGYPTVGCGDRSAALRLHAPGCLTVLVATTGGMNAWRVKQLCC